ncbi:MAG: 3-phosphoglycerate dehydrogenase family protein, partial [Gammaproteobacteria bacterium]
MSFRIQTLNNIAVAGLERFPRDAYEVASDLSRPDAILLRSFNLHDAEIPASVKAVARAGAGVNNIPVSELSRRGVPVFNTPGANANAVKELVVAGLLLAARNICAAWDFARDLSGQGEELARAVEEGKKKFAGSELPGRTLGVIGLGAIGVQVANAAHALGMRVIGYDPQITVHRAWQLSAGVEQAAGLDELFRRSDFVTPHVPLTDATRHIVNAERLAMLQPGSVLLNFAREGVVDDEAVISALDDGHLAAFVTDFPTRALLNHTRAICLPHLGASTREAEENCAVMAVDQLRDFLEHGIVRNSVNFPEVSLPQAEGYRLAVANANVPNMVGQMTTLLARADLNILDMLNRSRGELAYTVVDVDDPVPPDTV